MTPKEKANELVDKYYQLLPLKNDVITTNGNLSWEYDNYKNAIQCALIAVEEVIQHRSLDLLDPDIKPSHTESIELVLNYWQEVKNELKQM